MEMHTFNSDMNSTLILNDFRDAIRDGKDSDGNVVGDYHFMIAATAKKNKDVMAIGEELGIPNIHASKHFFNLSGFPFSMIRLFLYD